MTTCVVVDTETTGIRASDDRVIEIGAVWIRDGVIGDRFETLVNPGVSVPWRITRLTGISTRDLVGAPGPAEAWSRFLEFAGDAPLVAHHARFDRGFVEAELRRLGMEPPVRDWLCTVKLSRRLLPGLPSHGLDSVARFLAVPVGTRHRALADAEITAGVLLELADRASERGVDDMRGLVALQGARYATASVVPEHVARLRRDFVPTLPDAPGVYRMLDARENILYVGKATSLRDRVGSYFVAVEAKDVRLRELVRRTRSVSVQVTSTEIEARVVEARLIQSLQPPFNRAQREPGRRAWVRVDAGEGGNRTIAVRSWRGDDGAAWIGPLSGRGEAQGLAEAIGAVTGLTVERPRPRSGWARESEARLGSAARKVSEAARADPAPADWTVEEIPSHARGPIREAMLRASFELAFEEARILRDWLEALDRLDADGNVADTLTGDVAAVRAGDPVEVVLIRAGRMVGSVAGTGRPAAERVRDLVGRVPPDGPVVESRVGVLRARRGREDETWMLAQWIVRSGARTVRRDDGEPADAFASRIEEACV